MEVMVLGNVMATRLAQPSKASEPIVVRPVKYCSSLKEVMVELFPNVAPKSVAEAASAKLSSPSPLVSQLATQMAFTLTSAKTMLSGVLKLTELEYSLGKPESHKVLTRAW